MKNYIKYFGVISGIATFCTIFGMWGKLTHKSFADNLLTAGMWTLAVCAAIYVYLKITRFGDKN